MQPLRLLPSWTDHGHARHASPQVSQQKQAGHWQLLPHEHAPRLQRPPLSSEWSHAAMESLHCTCTYVGGLYMHHIVPCHTRRYTQRGSLAGTAAEQQLCGPQHVIRVIPSHSFAVVVYLTGPHVYESKYSSLTHVLLCFSAVRKSSASVCTASSRPGKAVCPTSWITEAPTAVQVTQAAAPPFSPCVPAQPRARACTGAQSGVMQTVAATPGPAPAATLHHPPRWPLGRSSAQVGRLIALRVSL